MESQQRHTSFSAQLAPTKRKDLSKICIYLVHGPQLTINRFYYADERKSDGSAAFKDIDGEAHAEHYLKLSEGKDQEAWQQTFVKGIGYRSF